jgi:D-alanyl-lipoteichoic acid acyltransferase DltB (MBOAT superfamily)
MLLGGLWHGANWTFLIWGAMHGAALIADHSWRRSRAFARYGAGGIARIVDWALTFHFVCFAWLFFRSPSLDSATQYLLGIWSDNGAQSTMPAIVPALIACGALTQIVPPQTRAALGAMLDERGAVAQAAFGFAILYVVIVMAPSASAAFIYFQF